MAKYARILVDLLFPRRCPVCGEIVRPEGELICPGCITRLSPVRQPLCKRCGKEVHGEQTEYCADCMRHPRSFESGAALLNYNAAARDSVAAVKYKNRREYLDFYAAAIDYRFRRMALNWQADVLVPVPIHPSRRRKRGFNQAEELAMRLGKLWKIPVETGLLVRSRKTMPQKNLNPRERLENLRQAFAVHPQWDVREPSQKTPGQKTLPRCVILIDDIYTTGSTIEACTQALKEAGVREVHMVVICIVGGRA